MGRGLTTGWAAGAVMAMDQPATFAERCGADVLVVGDDNGDVSAFRYPAYHHTVRCAACADMQARAAVVRGHAAAITSLRVWGDSALVTASAQNDLMCLWSIRRDRADEGGVVVRVVGGAAGDTGVCGDAATPGCASPVGVPDAEMFVS